MTQTQDQYSEVKHRVEAAAAASGREPSTVKLVAVSKTFDRADIEPVLQLGHRIFGENRVQEAHRKWSELRSLYEGIELHLIGPLQSNKVREAVELFDVIQTVDRPKLLIALANEIQKQNAQTKLFVQVNTGREPQKAGVLPEQLDQFIGECRGQLGSSLLGLMCIPPADHDPRPHFRLLKDMAKQYHLPMLSMGMSSDFEIAIEEGATCVRVGSAIFGIRPKPV